MKDLNLIPKNYIEGARKKKRRFFYFTAAVAAVIVLSSIMIMPLAVRLNIQNQRDILKKRLSGTETYVEVEKQFDVLRGFYEQRRAEADRLIGLGVDIDKVIMRLEDASPEKLFFTSMDINGGEESELNVALNGISLSIDEIATFASCLRQGEYFKDVVIVSVNSGSVNEDSGEEAGYVFNMRLRRPLDTGLKDKEKGKE